MSWHVALAKVADSAPTLPNFSRARAKVFRIRTYKSSRICIKTNDFNPFRISTYKLAHRIHKTKNFKSRRIHTYVIFPCNPFRIGTSKKPGEGVL